MIEKNLNVKFYTNNFKPSFDLNIEEFLEYKLNKHRWLETNHYYIQWLFPNF